MRKAFLMIIAPILALAIVLATGLAIWHFGSQSTSNQGNVDVSLENSTGIGDLTVNHKNFTLLLKSPSIYKGTDGVNIVKSITSKEEANIAQKTDIIATYINNNLTTTEPRRIKFSAIISLPIALENQIYLDLNINYQSLFKVNQQIKDRYVVERVFYIEPNTLAVNQTIELKIPTDIFNWNHMWVPNNEFFYNSVDSSLPPLKLSVDFKVEYVN